MSEPMTSPARQAATQGVVAGECLPHRGLPLTHEVAQFAEESRQLALSHYRLLQPHLEQDRILRSVANEAGVSLRTL